MGQEYTDLLIHVSRRAMACDFEVCFPAGRYPDGTRWALESLDAVEAVESQLSYFQPESGVSRINRLAAAGPVPVEPWLFELLTLAARLYAETHGAYDITSAPLWEAWGFARRAGRIPSDQQLAEAQACVGGHLLQLDPANQCVRFGRPGMRISLGSIGKGYALDVCAERLLSLGLNDFLLHAGQSSVLVRGFRAADDDAQRAAWEIGVRDPRHPERRLATVRLHDRAVGTSSAQFQSFRHAGRRYGHILDPRTGQPADNLLSATVVAPTAAMADALSTAFYVLGPDAALDYCRNHEEIGLLMLCPGQPHGALEIRTAGIPPGDLTRLA
ncbi:MAG: FAD:protein FMN transferase [Thermoguttaceae bacterium]